MLISTGAHAGADLLGYKPYLPRTFHDEFDAWAADFHDPWADLDRETHYEDADVLMGRASFVSRYGWESDTRAEHMHREGIAAEVVFPNGLDLDFLQTIADEIGPTVEEVATPVSPEELPRESMSATFMPALAAARGGG